MRWKIILITFLVLALIATLFLDCGEVRSEEYHFSPGSKFLVAGYWELKSGCDLEGYIFEIEAYLPDGRVRLKPLNQGNSRWLDHPDKKIIPTCRLKKPLIVTREQFKSLLILVGAISR